MRFVSWSPPQTKGWGRGRRRATLGRQSARALEGPATDRAAASRTPSNTDTSVEGKGLIVGGRVDGGGRIGVRSRAGVQRGIGVHHGRVVELQRLQVRAVDAVLAQKL